MSDFLLHPRLEADTAFAADWPLCTVLLMNDARYPWLILVPRRAVMMEIHQLAPADRVLLMEEVTRASLIVRKMPGVEKINVGALGNMVPQLHVHVIGRHVSDPAWPGPVWGHSPAQPYGAREQAERIALVRSR
ncbi:MAG TPA: HIT domain-containing protein [Rhizomicrobium sp.]